MGAHCSRSAYAPLLRCLRAVWNRRKPGSTETLPLKAPLFTWSVKSDSCYNVPQLCSARCMKQTLWIRQTMHLHKCDRHIFTRTLSKNGRSLEPFWVLQKFHTSPLILVNRFINHKKNIFLIWFSFFLGAGIFVTTVVAGSIALVKPFTVASRPFLRDVVFYMAAVFWTFNILYKGHISMGEAVGTITVFHLIRFIP